MDRTERQKLGIRRWINCNGHGVLEYATGVGKTHCAIMLIQSLYTRNPNLSVLIGVPTDVLKNQWNRELAKNNLFTACKVEIFNTIIKNEYNVNLFVIDEVHLSASHSNIYMYECVTYKYILGLTATWERLDHGEQRLEPYISVCDTISLEEALSNNWIAQYRNYKVLLNVDLTDYYILNNKFQSVFSVFGHDFKLIMELLKDRNKLRVWAKNSQYDIKVITGYLASFMKLLKNRKSFVMSHEKKFEIANKILESRKSEKCITFSATIKDAERFKNWGYVLHSKKKKAENTAILQHFNESKSGILSTSKACNQGVDIKGLSVGILLTCDSSITTMVQKIGRVARKEDNKISEIFTLVIANSIEEQWFNNANRNQTYITINEDQLNIILDNKDISVRPKQGLVDIENRF